MRMLYFSTATYPNREFYPFFNKELKGNVWHSGKGGGHIIEMNQISFQELLQIYLFFDCEMKELPRCPESEGRKKRTESRIIERSKSRKKSRQKSKKRLFVYYPGINSKKLKAIFEKYGTLIDMYVVKMKPSTIGFVEFETEEQAQRAREKVHLTKYKHHKIKVQFAKVR